MPREGASLSKNKESSPGGLCGGGRSRAWSSRPCQWTVGEEAEGSDLARRRGGERETAEAQNAEPRRDEGTTSRGDAEARRNVADGVVRCMPVQTAACSLLGDLRGVRSSGQPQTGLRVFRRHRERQLPRNGGRRVRVGRPGRDAGYPLVNMVGFSRAGTACAFTLRRNSTSGGTWTLGTRNCESLSPRRNGREEGGGSRGVVEYGSTGVWEYGSNGVRGTQQQSRGRMAPRTQRTSRRACVFSSG